MFDNFYGMEADNDEIVLDPKETINDETAVDNGEAGSDMVTTDVSNISEKEAAHNEAASAGGVSTGDNQEQLEMDPVAATEAYLLKRFSMSSEDVDALVHDMTEYVESKPETEDPVDPDVAAGIVIVDDQSVVTDGESEVASGEDCAANDPATAAETSEESLNPELSTEKAFGYITAKDLKTKDKTKDIKKFSSAKDFLNSDLCKSKITQLTKDIKAKGLKIATAKEINENRPTILAALRGTHDRNLSVNFTTVNGITFAYFNEFYAAGTYRTSGSSYGFMASMSFYAMCVNKKGKVTSVKFASGITLNQKINSKESLDPVDNEIANMLGW